MKRPGNDSILSGLLLTSALTGAFASETAAPRLYEVTTRTGMPHLEENLRYAVVTERRCMSPGDLSDAFWMLKDVSMQDCRLVKSQEDPRSAHYILQCDGGHGTTGDARWQLSPDTITGTLSVRLGGKNMTFFQRIVARPIGVCAEPSPRPPEQTAPRPLSAAAAPTGRA